MFNHPVLVVLKDENGREMIINVNNMTSIKSDYSSQYIISFVSGPDLTLDWKRYDAFTKALEVVYQTKE